MESSTQLSSAQLGIVLFRGQSLWRSVILEVSAMIDNHSSQSLRLHVLVIMAEEEVIGCCSFT